MALYRLICEVKSARGSQSWTVEADTEAEAIAKHKRGESEFEDDEIEVTDVSNDPHLVELVEPDQAH